MDPLPPLPEVIAHRGYSAVAPENTLIALERAMDAGANAVEFDLQTAACGTPVLFHDPTLGRTTNGVGPLRRRPLGHLKALDAGGWFGADFSGERIPTQEEALELLKRRSGRVYQEIKGYREMEDLDRMVEITRKAGMESQATFISLDWVVLNRVRMTAPGIRRGYIVEDESRYAEALDRAVVDEGSLLDLRSELALARPGFVEEALREGVEVGVWTVDDPDQAAELLAAGVTRITTNQVERMLGWKATLVD